MARLSGNDAGDRDTLPTRSKRGYRRWLEEQEAKRASGSDIVSPEEGRINLRKACPDRGDSL